MFIRILSRVPIPVRNILRHVIPGAIYTVRRSFLTENYIFFKCQAFSSIYTAETFLIPRLWKKNLAAHPHINICR
jgi:hypothetical protein